MLMISFRNHSICRQYRKYKEIYEVDLDIIKNVIKDCDVKLKEINDMIDKKNKKLKGGTIHKITENDKIYILIPSGKI